MRHHDSSNVFHGPRPVKIFRVRGPGGKRFPRPLPPFFREHRAQRFRHALRRDLHRLARVTRSPRRSERSTGGPMRARNFAGRIRHLSRGSTLSAPSIPRGTTCGAGVERHEGGPGFKRGQLSLGAARSFREDQQHSSFFEQGNRLAERAAVALPAPDGEGVRTADDRAQGEEEEPALAMKCTGRGKAAPTSGGSA